MGFNLNYKYYSFIWEQRTLVLKIVTAITDFKNKHSIT